ncbi:MAG: lipocalin family protein [Bacteroidetes bacterium]|jgi:apolipoprotein D and lipocalin family protein|nr:lipocalin family protein [Bacteroidota bacterium]
MKKEIIAGTALAGLGIAAFALATRNKPLKTVGHVELEKYLGKWYEIAKFPQSFENGCTNVTAEYSLRDDGKISVVNSCTKDGQPKTTEGIASIDDKESNAKLEVQFQWPFSGKYWIIALAPDYSYAVVGHPNRKYLWILNRKPIMDTMTYNHLVLVAASRGFDIRKLVKTVQTEVSENAFSIPNGHS